MSKSMIKRKEMAVSIEGIRARLPHRYPFLMIDRIVKQDKGKCIAIKCITINECQFQGHFPEQAIMPGMLIAEAMAQAASFVGPSNYEPGQVQELPDKPQKGFLITMNIKFKNPVIPGDVLVLDVKLIKEMGDLMSFQGKATVENEIVAEGTFSVAKIND